MGLFTAGEVRLVEYPYSDLSGSKLRPVLLLRELMFNDWISCQITSRPLDPTAVRIDSDSFAAGGLRKASYVRCGKLFTANESILSEPEGRLRPDVLTEVVEALVALLRTYRIN